MEENNSNQNPSKFDPRAVVDDLKQATTALQKETQNLNSGISGIDGKLKESRELIDHSLKELKESVMNIRVGISPEDLKKLESYKDYFKHYKPVLYISLFVMLSGWGLAIFGAYSGLKYYKESIRTKQEIRVQVLQDIGNDGNVIVPKEQWENYQFQNEVLKEWKKTNPEDSKSLIDYGNGYKAKQKK
jgi:hypothetical protein